MKHFRLISKKRLISAKTETALLVVSIALAVSVLFSCFSLEVNYIGFFIAEAENLTGSPMSGVMANAKANIVEMGEYMYDLFMHFYSGQSAGRDEPPIFIPIADNSEALFSSHALVENLPLTVSFMTAIVLLTVYVSLSIMFAVCKRERRSFFVTLLASGATVKQIKKCAFYEAVYYCAAAIPAGLLLGCIEVWGLKLATEKIFEKLSLGGEKLAFSVDIRLSVLALVITVIIALLIVCRFSVSACKNLSVRTIATQVKRKFATSIGISAFTESPKAYIRPGIEFYIAFRNFHNNLGKYFKIIGMTILYVMIISSSLMIFSAARSFIGHEVIGADSALISFSYASEIYICFVALMISVVTFLSTVFAVVSNINSNEGEYALMRSVGASTKSITKAVRIEGFICSVIGVCLCTFLVFIFYAAVTYIYSQDSRVSFGSADMLILFLFVSMGLFSLSVILTSFSTAEKMKKINLIGVLKDFAY